MAHHIGETYSAHITRVRPFGLVAPIDATLIEELIPVDSLPAGPCKLDAREVALVWSSARKRPSPWECAYT